MREIVVALAVLLIAAVQPRAFDPRRGSLPARVAQPIYARDPADPWNQVFYLLFTRNVPARVIADGARPFAAGDERLAVSERRVVRVESGDRAIDPLYPSWLWMGSTSADFSRDASWRVLDAPTLTSLIAALDGVRRSAPSRPPVARALMQADLWSAFEMLAGAARDERAAQLRAALAATIAELALTGDDIARLPDNYAAAARQGLVPDMFNRDAGWMEIRWFSTRSHETAVGDRRATRVFVKPLPSESNRRALLHRLQNSSGESQGLSAVALVTQLLLVAKGGRVVASPLTFDVQVRGTAVEQFELSRRELLSRPDSGGFARQDATDPAYMPIAGNDFSFATPPQLDGEPVVAPLAMRCAACHGASSGLGHLMTFSMTVVPGGPAPVVHQLDPAENLHGRDVAARKAATGEFRALLKLMTR